MNKKTQPVIITLAIALAYFCQCSANKNALQDYTVIRNNYFDTAGYKLPARDTNAFNRQLLEQVVAVAGLTNSTTCYLVETVFDQAPAKECCLFDAATRKYYKLNSRDKEVAFTETTDPVCRKQLDFVNGNISGLQAKAQAYDSTVRFRHDMASYIASIIEVRDKIIFIQSYYLTSL